jgi:hypothetical protein
LSLDLEHLDTSAREAVALPLEARLHSIRSELWIGYPRASQIIARMEDLLLHPKTHRMPNLLLTAVTNNGKTHLLHRFAARHPGIDDPNAENVVVPVLLIQAPPVPDERRFLGNILEAFDVPHRPHQTAADRMGQVLRVLRQVQLRMLIVDEIQHVLVGASRKQGTFLNTLKYLGNDLEIPIVGAGIPEAARAIESDPQLSNRFQPAALPRWSMSKEYLQLLASFERLLPLRNPSRLTNAELANRILGMSEGTIGEVVALLRQAAVEAVRSGRELIDVELLRRLDWTAPSQRRRRAEQVN